jgi:hypothetical protein
MVAFYIPWVNLIERCRLLVRERKLCNSSSLWVQHHLKRRGYKQSIMKKRLDKAHSNSSGSLFQYKKKQKCKRTHCVLTYHHSLRNSFNTIREHWASVEKNSKQYNIFPAPPMVAFKQSNSMKNQLVWGEMSKSSTTIGKSHSCGHKAQERCCTVWNFFRRMPNAHEWCWSCFLESDGMWGHNGFFYISVFICTEINCPWNIYELCLNFIPLVLYRKVNNPQIYIPNLPTPINTFCLAAFILLMWLRANHTVKLLESGEFVPTTNLFGIFFDGCPMLTNGVEAVS